MQPFAHPRDLKAKIHPKQDYEFDVFLAFKSMIGFDRGICFQELILLSKDCFHLLLWVLFCFQLKASPPNLKL